ncbi:MAG: PDZ domain-containing protein [candidate division Zixibacteria bacterium]|nr:PDZ domain-containing protein [candidate division Zixibacteria bacterium]
MGITRVLTAMLLAVAALLAGQGAVGQAVMHKLEGDGFFLVQETGAMVLQRKDTLRVDFLPPVEARPREYASVDFRVGDIILMLNGKRVSDAKQLEDLYKGIKAGEEVSFGIKREGTLRMVKFVRADESKLPKRQMMMMRNEGPGGKNEIQLQTRDGMKSFSGEGVNVLPAAGLVIGLKDKKITVIGVLPIAAENISGGEPKEGDVIVTANGKEFDSTDQLVSFVSELSDGAKVELGLRRDGTIVTVSFTKTPGKVRKVIKSN